MNRRFVWLYVVPIMGLLAWSQLSLISGRETLILRDVLNTHLEMKHALAEGLKDGYVPLVDQFRAGGQPLAGNPNAVPFYPDNLLFLVGSIFWALNAHFWLHFLLAPLCFYPLGRAWGLSREASWTAGICYALSGYFISNLSFYNLIAGVTLAPLFIAAGLQVADPELRSRRRWIVLFGVTWALLILGGDPLLALESLALVGGALAVRKYRRARWPRATWIALGGALLCGTLLALPQIVEFLRILPVSYRGVHGFSGQTSTVASWDPRQLVEWFVPFAFGRPDRLGPGGFWGHEFFTGKPPYYFSLYPGLLALALVVTAGRPRQRVGYWAWGAILLGIFLALGRFNPIAEWLLSLPGGGASRYPVKFWLPVALGGSLLTAIGVERLLSEGKPARRRLGRVLGVLALLFAVLWLGLSRFPGMGQQLLGMALPSGAPDAMVSNERLRWAGLSLISLVVVLVMMAANRWARLPGKARVAIMLWIHVAAQLFFLRPAMATDQIETYRQPPRLLQALPETSLLVHGAWLNLFGTRNLHTNLPGDGHYRWIERRSFAQLYPFAGTLWGRRYEFNASPEGLNTFLSKAASQLVEHTDDATRIRLLRSWGVNILLLDRDLEPAAQSDVELRAVDRSTGVPLNVYELPSAVPQVGFVGQVHYAPHVNAAVERLLDESFDARHAVVLAGEKRSQVGVGGSVVSVEGSTETLCIEVDAESAGVLVVQRAHLPIYRASVDDDEVAVRVANVYRIGVEVPPGKHSVQLWVDRRPLRRSLIGVAFGVLGLIVLARIRIDRQPISNVDVTSR